MKQLKALCITLLALCITACGSNNQTIEKTMENSINEPVMGLGNKIEGNNFTGDAWLNILSAESNYDCQVYNVTFAPSVRNSWHSHAVGQILLCTEGVGYYQERGKPAQRLEVGAVVNIPADVEHWHGAAPDSEFTHIGITPKESENSAVWLEPVTDEDYMKAVGAESMPVAVESIPQKSSSEKKNIGSVLALYPKPVTVIGTLSDGKANFMTMTHTGIIGHDRIMLSMRKSHFSNKAARETRKLSVNMVDEALLPRADYAGTVSGTNENKSTLFEYTIGDEGMPIINDSPLVMECIVEDIYETETFDNFICKIANTYADEAIINEDGKIDYAILKPILFEMPNYQYLRTGEVIGKARTLGKK